MNKLRIKLNYLENNVINEGSLAMMILIGFHIVAALYSFSSDILADSPIPTTTLQIRNAYFNFINVTTD